MTHTLTFPNFIVLADDDADDRQLFYEAVVLLNPTIHLELLEDGEALMAYLKNEKRQLPELVFLDLNMPRLNGFECLEEIRKDIRLSKLPVIIYSTSGQNKDIMESLQKGANLYFIKPTGLLELSQKLKNIFELDFKDYQPTVALNRFVIQDGMN